LQGKRSILTGGASGIGAATVRRFVAEGARVLIADGNLPEAERLAKELGNEAAAIECDVR
jgi:NAD(P)-dependent dehydrogenase (short-subunit alcohol dehydrogenase family)